MRTYWNNQLDTATFTESTTKLGSDVNDIIQKHLSKRFSFDDNFGNIVIDLGVATNIKKFLLGGSNCTASGSITLEGNTTSDFTSPAYSGTAILYDSTWTINLDESYRYWRVSATDATLTYFWIGYIFMGEGLQLPGIDPNFILNYNTTSATTLSVSLQPYGDKGIENFSSGFTFPIITDYIRQSPSGEDIATRADILEMWYTVEGHTPFYLEIAEDSLDIIPPFFGIFNQGSMSFVLDKSQGFYKTSFEFQETK